MPRSVSVLAALLLLLFGGCTSQSFLFEHGDADLSAYDFNRSGEVRLDGPWLFRGVSGTTSHPVEKRLPGYWNATLPEFPVEGHGTYQLKVRLPASTAWWSLNLPEFSSATRVRVDGLVILETGVVATTETQEVPRVQNRLVSFYAVGPVVSIEIEVSNFHDRIGGAMESIRFGPLRSMEASWNLSRFLSSFLGGALLVLGMLNLFVYHWQNKRPGILWFSIMSFLFALRTLITGPAPLREFLPDLGFELVTSLKYLTALGTISAFVLYLRRVFPRWWQPQVFMGFLFYTLFFGVLSLFLPTKLFSEAYARFYTLPLSLIMVYCFALFAFSWLRNHPEGRAMTPGVFLLLAGGLSDTLNISIAMPWGLIMPQCMFLFMLYNSWLVSTQMQKTYELSQKQAAELHNLDHLKDDFLARVTHELRTPLHGVVSLLDGFRQGDFGPIADRQDYQMSLLQASSQRLLSMVNSILDFSQVRQGKVGVTMAPVRLVDLAAAVIADRQGTAKPGVILVNRVSPHMPMAWGDPGRVEQILRHLVTNACQHTRSGTISIEGEVVAYRVVVQIRDTGEGISAPLLSSLFVPFQQNSDADTRSKNGLGLGLAISRQLADSMSAVLTVDSQLGVGTRARLSLLPCPADQARSLTPSVAVKRPSLPVPALPPAPDPGVPKPEESPLVLIVDDEPVNLMILRSYLGRLNLSVLEAESGPRALELIAQHPVKLVILDVMMPGMSGYEVSRKLRESYTPEQLPIILLTAKEQQEDMVKGFASGATDFIIKPYEREDLRRRIEFQLSLTSTK